jgi:hypothetical protein
MNDFTKEELEEIKYFIFGNPKSNNDLCLKIQSMIDNYCEHDWVHSYREKEYELCSKCGEEL